MQKHASQNYVKTAAHAISKPKKNHLCSFETNWTEAQ